MNKAQYEYEQLTIMESMDKELISHEEFQRQFIHQYDFLTDRGNIPAKVTYNKNDKTVSIEIEQELPNATNGIYQGYAQYTQCLFSIEYKHDNPYFCVRKNTSSIYRFPNKKEDSHVFTTQLDVYLNNTHVGNIEYIGSQNVYKGYNKRVLPNVIPDLQIGFAIQGMAPLEKPNSELYDWNVTAKGRYAGYPQGIVQETTVTNMLRNGRKYEKTSRLITVSKENPHSLDYVGAVVAEMKHGSVLEGYKLPENSKFKNVEEAIEYYANQCSEYFSRESHKSR